MFLYWFKYLAYQKSLLDNLKKGNKNTAWILEKSKYFMTIITKLIEISILSIIQLWTSFKKGSKLKKNSNILFLFIKYTLYVLKHDLWCIWKVSSFMCTFLKCMLNLFAFSCVKILVGIIKF